MKRRLTVIIVIALVCLALIIWLIWANGALVLTGYTVSSGELPEEFDGFRIAQVSDLHNASFGEDNEELLGLLRSAEPDIIAVTGDLIDSRHTDVETAVKFIEAASEIAPVYYVTGNHEARLDFDEIEPQLIEAGAVVLRNASAYVELGAARIQIAGIDDPSFLGSSGSADERAAAELEGVVDADAYTVLLAHRPELIDTYAAAGAELILSGHAHGGQVRLPLIGGLYAPGQGFLPEYDAGVFESGGSTMVVSRGLGASMFPLRVNNRPELVLIILRCEM